jgi:hypothetical protein
MYARLGRDEFPLTALPRRWRKFRRRSPHRTESSRSAFVAATVLAPKAAHSVTRPRASSTPLDNQVDERLGRRIGVLDAMRDVGATTAAVACGCPLPDHVPLMSGIASCARAAVTTQNSARATTKYLIGLPPAEYSVHIAGLSHERRGRLHADARRATTIYEPVPASVRARSNAGKGRMTDRVDPAESGATQ